MATTGYAGATAFTSALALLGGPYGMIAGFGVLVPLGQISDSLAKYSGGEVDVGRGKAATTGASDRFTRAP